MIPSKDELLRLAETLKSIADDPKYFPFNKAAPYQAAAILEQLAETDVSYDGALCVRKDRTDP